MEPKNFVVGVDNTSANKPFYAYFIHNQIEYGFTGGVTKEEAVTKLCDQLAKRLGDIADLLVTPTKL